MEINMKKGFRTFIYQIFGKYKRKNCFYRNMFIPAKSIKEDNQGSCKNQFSPVQGAPIPESNFGCDLFI